MTVAKLLQDRFGQDLATEWPEPIDAVLSRVLARRTHRRFTDEPVPDAFVDLLLCAALLASSKSDFQQASVIKVRDPEKRTAMAQHFPSMPWIGTAPAFLVFCADARRLDRISSLRGHPQPNKDLEAFLNAAVDAALVLQTCLLCAEAVGLGCCPISVIRNQLPRVAEILKLPAGVFPVAGLCLGYPSGPAHVSMRLPPSLTVHTDAYDDSRLAQEIDAYDRRRDARHGIGRDQQRNAAKFGYADFYGWSEDKARQAAEPEGASFASHVKQTWFLF
jgi:FMN reductase [NAD(P)H]